MVNNFGSPNACLDRFTELSDNPPQFTGRKKTVAKCTFGIAYNHLRRCSRCWSGRVAYVTEWNDFKRKNEKEWSQVMNLVSFIVQRVVITLTILLGLRVVGVSAFGIFVECAFIELFLI